MEKIAELNNPCKELWYEQRIKELERQLWKAMQVIEAFCEDEGYVPKRTEKLMEELETVSWAALTE